MHSFIHLVTTTKQLRTFSPSFNRNKESGSSLKLFDSEYVPPVKLIECKFTFLYVKQNVSSLYLK